ASTSAASTSAGKMNKVFSMVELPRDGRSSAVRITGVLLEEQHHARAAAVVSVLDVQTADPGFLEREEKGVEVVRVHLHRGGPQTQQLKQTANGPEPGAGDLVRDLPQAPARRLLLGVGEMQDANAAVVEAVEQALEQANTPLTRDVLKDDEGVDEIEGAVYL